MYPESEKIFFGARRLPETVLPRVGYYTTPLRGYVK